MAEERQGEKRQPARLDLSTIVLRFLVFAAYAFVLFEATVGLGGQDISTNRVWVIIAALVGLLILLGIDRLTGLRVTPGSVEATLAEAKAGALQEVNNMEDPQLADAARAQILQAETASQVEGALGVAKELNVTRIVDRVKEAIRQKRQLYVRYQADPTAPVEAYMVAPLDIRPGEKPGARLHDYLWAYSYKHGHVVSLRLERILGIELSEETFDPAEVTKDQKETGWNVPREW